MRRFAFKTDSEELIAFLTRFPNSYRGRVIEVILLSWLEGNSSLSKEHLIELFAVRGRKEKKAEEKKKEKEKEVLKEPEGTEEVMQTAEEDTSNPSVRLLDVMEDFK